ncbi:hypothetical protein SAMN04487926_13534 [Paraburkholderia steynii]|uniref:Uncharacterized protein n=1 Tax=Paraburkholderia steynii TaxID=1245441 RepID=A0A7Z7BG12_9BURK|nr:hypothetical protein SAMN04487926_13534 [Paraburkholderia steynii]
MRSRVAPEVLEIGLGQLSHPNGHRRRPCADTHAPDERLVMKRHWISRRLVDLQRFCTAQTRVSCYSSGRSPARMTSLAEPIG